MKKSKRKYLLDKSILAFLEKNSQKHEEEIRAVEALMHVFKKLFKRISKYHSRVVHGGDDEDLHKLRVACRQSVSLIGEFYFLFEDDVMLRHRKALKKIISQTNKKRDLDVFKIQLIQSKENFKGHKEKEALHYLKQHLDKMLKIEHKKVIHYLQSEKCKTLLDSWKDFIKYQYKFHSTIYGAYSPLALSKYVIFRRFLKIKKMIHNLDSEREIYNALHKLRIAYKKLRYLLEAFSYLYNKKKIKSLLKEMKNLQDILGALHDKYQQKMMLEDLLKAQKGLMNKSFTEDKILSKLKRYQEKEMVEIQGLLEDFIAKKTRYGHLFDR